MARRSTLRASDADRERIADRLRNAAAEGRLLAEELEQRIGATFEARTYGHLDALVADLPDESRAPVRWRSVVAMRRPLGVLAVALLAAAVVALVALLITGIVLVGGAWIFLCLWFFGCRGTRCRPRYHRYPRMGRWQQVHGPADRRAWL